MNLMLPATLCSFALFVMAQTKPSDVERALRIIEGQTQNSRALNAEKEIQKIRSERQNPALDEIDKLEEQFRQSKETNVLRRLATLVSKADRGAYAALSLRALCDVISSNNFEQIVLPEIIKGVESGPDSIKGACIEVLGACSGSSKTAIHALINVIRTNPEKVGLLDIIDLFGNAPSQKSITVPVLIELLQEPERPFEELRSSATQHTFAAKALSKLGAPKESHLALRAGLTSSNPYTRLECANALLLNNVYLDDAYNTFLLLLRMKESFFREEALLYMISAKHEFPDQILIEVRRLRNDGSKEQRDLAGRLLELLHQ